MTNLFSYVIQIFQRAKKAVTHTPVTIEYPYVASPFPLHSRIKLNNNFSECTVCLDCEKICPTKAISIQTEEFSPQIARPKTNSGKSVERALNSFHIDYSKCTFCGICVQSCSPESLSYERAIVNPETQVRLLRKEMYSNKKG